MRDLDETRLVHEGVPRERALPEPRAEEGRLAVGAVEGGGAVGPRAAEVAVVEGVAVGWVAREAGWAGLAVGEGEEDLVARGDGRYFRAYIEDDAAACSWDEESVCGLLEDFVIGILTFVAEDCAWRAGERAIGGGEVSVADARGVDLDEGLVGPDGVEADLAELKGALDVGDDEGCGGA